MNDSPGTSENMLTGSVKLALIINWSNMEKLGIGFFVVVVVISLQWV